MRARLPSPALGVACLALIVAFTGTAAAATGTIMNLADGTTGTLAKVDSAGKVAVGDGAGNLTVDGTVDVRRAAPGSAFRKTTEVFGSASCSALYAPPNGKAAIVTSFEVVAYDAGATPGAVARLYVNDPASGPCGWNPGAVAYVDIPSKVTTQLNFEPGIN